MSQEIVQTILKHINASDFWARARWGVKQMMSDTKECTLHLVLGGGRGKVMVKYDAGPDTYTVTFGRVVTRGARRGEWIELGKRDDVYSDSIVTVVDGLLKDK
jgi:hypothetical protein